MTMEYMPAQSSATEQAVPPAAERELVVGTITGSQPFTPAPPEEQEPAAAAAAEAPTTETPSQDFVPRAEFEAIKKQAEELAAWRAQQEAERQSAVQQQTQAQKQAIRQQIEAHIKANYAEEADVPVITTALETYMQFKSPEFQQALQAHAQQYTTYERTHAARALILEHLAPTIPAYIAPGQPTPPQLVLKLLADWETELLSFGQGKEVMASLAKRWAQDRITANGEARRASGAEATERGSTTFGGGASPVARYKEALRTGKPLPSAAEIDRLTAGFR